MRISDWSSDVCSSDLSFEVTDYSTELRVGDDSAIVGKTVAEIERESDGAITVIGIVRSERRLIGRLLYESIRAGDVLMVQSDSETLQKLVKGQQLELAERDTESETETEKRAAAEELQVDEAVIQPASWRSEGHPSELPSLLR